MGHTDHWHDLQNLPAKPGTTVMHRKGQMVNHLHSKKLPLCSTRFESATLQVAPSLPEDLSRRWHCFIFPFVPWSFSLQIICKQIGHITVTYGRLTPTTFFSCDIRGKQIDMDLGKLDPDTKCHGYHASAMLPLCLVTRKVSFPHWG